MADPAPQLAPTPNTPEPTQEQPIDREVTAIARVNAALVGLPPEVQHRVLHWANQKFGVAQAPAPPAPRKPPASEHGEEPGGAAEQGFPDFASLYDATNPNTNADRALVAGYWLQVVQGNADWTGFDANKELKHMGHGTDDITGALTQLIDSTPRYVLQTHKSGQARQARKKYKVTHEGVRRVKQMISGGAGADGNNGG
jgi:hypothetical protein